MDELGTLAAALRDPAVLTGLAAVAGTLAIHLSLKRKAAGHLAGQVALLALLTGALVAQGIVPYAVGPETASLRESVFIGLAKIVWWINAALVLVGLVRAFLIFERRPREGRLIQDLLVGLIYGGAALSVVANVFSLPVGTLIATSGVVAIILGLALQSTLADVFSGIALNISRPYAVGDWIILSEGLEGRVIETNWRATHLVNASNELIILPNSKLARATLTNSSGPDRRHGAKLRVRLQPTLPPLAIAKVMRDVLLSSTAILPSPPPTVHVKGLDAHAIEMELSFHVADLSASSAAKDEVLDLVYRHAKAAGLALAPPPGAAPEPAAPPGAADLPGHRPTPLRLLDAVPLFSSLTEDEKEALAATMARRTYRRGEVVVEEGAAVSALMIVRSGVLAVARRGREAEIELARLAPGDVFGEEGLLMGAGEKGTVRALTFVVVYAIAKAGLAPLLADRPGIADELSAVLARRAEAGRRDAPDARMDRDPHQVSHIAERIRAYFKAHWEEHRAGR